MHIFFIMIDNKFRNNTILSVLLRQHFSFDNSHLKIILLFVSVVNSKIYPCHSYFSLVNYFIFMTLRYGFNFVLCLTLFQNISS